MSKTPTQNETHAVCDERLAREGGNARCCECEPHKNCMHMRILMKKNQMRSKLLERLDFLSDHWVKGDDRPPFSFGGWREEVADDFVEIYKNYLADARKEVIAGLDEKIEKLAELEHEQWWKWAKTLTEKETLSKERIERWQKDMVPYKDLSEDVKEYDRKWARKVLATLREEKTK